MVSSVLTGVQNDNLGSELNDLLHTPDVNLMGRVIMPRLMAQQNRPFSNSLGNFANQGIRNAPPGFHNSNQNPSVNKEIMKGQERTASRFQFAVPSASDQGKAPAPHSTSSQVFQGQKGVVDQSGSDGVFTQTNNGMASSTKT